MCKFTLDFVIYNVLKIPFIAKACYRERLTRNMGSFSARRDFLRQTKNLAAQKNSEISVPNFRGVIFRDAELRFLVFFLPGTLNTTPFLVARFFGNSFW